MFNAEHYWITIAEMGAFSVDADRTLTRLEFEELTQCLSLNPLYGEVIADTDGIRILKWPAASQGRKGCVRVLYYFRDLNTPVYLIAMLERGERLSLSSANKRVMRMLVGEIVAAYGRRREITSRFTTGAA